MITTSPIYRKAARAFLKTSGYVRTGLVEVATGGDVVNGASSWEELP